MNKVNKTVGIKKTINKRISILSFIVCFSFLIILIFTSRIIIFEHDYYSVKLSKMTSNVYESKTAPRGRIYDRNHKLLVDNKKVAALYYFKPNKITEREEVKLAKDISFLVSLDISKVNERMMKDYYLVTNSRDAMKLITDEEWEKYENRKLSSDDIYRLKLSRITKDELDKYTDDDKKVIYIYYLMNNGYFYDDYATVSVDDTVKRFANNQAAFWVGNGATFFVGCLEINPDGNYAFLPDFCSKEGGKKFVGIGEGDAFGIWKDSEHADAAKAFLNFMARPENNVLLTASSGYISSLKSAMKMDDGIALKYMTEMQEKCANDDILYENLWDRKYMPSGMWPVFKQTVDTLIADPSENGVQEAKGILLENYKELYEAAQND